MSRVRVQRAFVLFTVLALLVASVGTADAKKRKKKKGGTVPSVVVIESAQGTQIHGTVESKKSPCIDGRKVHLTHNGNPISAAEADSEGQWFSVATDGLRSGDSINARLDEIKVKSGKKKVTCGSDTDRMVVNPDGRPDDDDDSTGGSGTRRLTVSVSGNGRVDSSPSGINNCRNTSGTCVADFPFGTNVSLTATPDDGNTFNGWTGDCSGTTQPCRVTMNQNRAVGANFAADGGGGGSSCPADVMAIPVLGPVLCTVIDLLTG